MPVSGFVEGWSKADVTYHWSNAETRHISLSDLRLPDPLSEILLTPSRTETSLALRRRY